MAYLFVLALVFLAVVMIAAKKASEFIKWCAEKIKEGLESPQGEVTEETEPL